jgi:hypothetical protein
MTPVRATSLALVTPADADAPSSSGPAPKSGRERRAFTRLSPLDLKEPLTARLKYGETITLLDVSVGGALFETSNRLRPEADLVLEVSASPNESPTHIVSRILRCEVVGLREGVIYRGACAFKRPFTHPALAAQPPAPATPPGDFLKLEFALKTIVEGYFRGQAGSGTGPWKDTSALLVALDRLRSAALRRDEPLDKRLAELLGTIVPALQRNEAPEAVVQRLQDQLRRYVPLLAFRGAADASGTAPGRESLTFNVLPHTPQDAGAVIAEFPNGFGLDETQFRLLKAGAYLLGLAERWTPAQPPPPPVVAPAAIEVAPAPIEVAPVAAPSSSALPEGWQRVVVRFVDGKLLRGYSNDFHPDRGHLHLCPSVSCPAGERLLVPVAQLKAVFFVRDLQGNPERVDSSEFDHDPRARKLEVTFRDGEVMKGSTLSYKPHSQGFFLTPADSRGNNLRVYVVNGAMQHMRFV